LNQERNYLYYPYHLHKINRNNQQSLILSVRLESMMERVTIP